MMTHCNGYEIQDTFGNKNSCFDHSLPFQDGEQALESVTFNDSHKKQLYEAVSRVKTSIFSKSPANVPSLPRKDERVLPSALKEGSSNIKVPSWSLQSEKTVQALDLKKYSTGNTILDCQAPKISTSSFGEDEEGTGNNTLCSDYPFQGKRGSAHHKKYGDISSANAFGTVLRNGQRDREDDMQFYDCPNIIGDFEDFNRVNRNIGTILAQWSTVTKDEISPFSAASLGFLDMEDTLQSVVPSSVSELSAFNNTSSYQDLCTNILLATEPSAIKTETIYGPHCSPLPMYLNTEKAERSVISERAYIHAEMAEKSSVLEHIGYGNEWRDPSKINMTLKELHTTTGKKVNSTLGSSVQCSLCGCGFIQNFHSPELLSSVVSAPQPCYSQAISIENLLSESHASSCLHSYNPQAQLSDILELQHVCPTLNSPVAESSALSDYATSNNPSNHAPQFIGNLPWPISMTSVAIEKNENMFGRQKFAAASSSLQRKYKFEDEVEGNKKSVYTSGNLPAVTIGPSSLHGNSCMSGTSLDDMSLTAANFQQLQMIIDQLGVRTKLCIRDGLYRLARSAEQSHYYVAENNADSGTSPMIGLQGVNGSKRPPEILGVSISKNAIERSVAYLLFQKSLESSTESPDDGIWLKSPIQINCTPDNCKENAL
ncbi:uncharacterized protein LOC110021769 [Phalaenopsis equestris]|uniref:uncharacterized protein LOC110021769 n=1 Tax=Phalaenopsis equestris TaxID=78828 RepID=UPI0009E3F94C|nr:uncharacterized protein LOC110021769 [Phalaenopsis equestris]XP_020576062.1 uncharacterized protein LOC110021769 [Phalaenopsis equestris]